MNKKRQAIWNKSNGKCWYCGCDLPVKGWHADHVEPVIRNLATGKPEHPERDSEENKVPACSSCNIQKGNMSLDTWRKIIKGHVKSLNRDITQYKVAKRFGLVEEKEIDVTFWFERQGEVQHDR